MFPMQSRGPVPLAKGFPLLRVRTALRRARLDAALAAGTDPTQSRELSLRAGQITARKRRLRIAASLLDAVAVAERPPGGAAVPVHRPAVREARAALMSLARELAERPLLSPRGVALVSKLLRDGTGPLYRTTANGELAAAVDHARRALYPC
jgi:hypothetical protein